MNYLIAGLGNIGKEYEKTRHNYGFLAIDYLGKHFRENPQWAQMFYEKKRDDAQVAEFEVFYNHGRPEIENNDHYHLILAKPETMMNNSGLSVKKLCRAYKIKPENLILIHDELDIPLGQVKISFDSSPAGHNGVSSVVNQLGTQKFIRLRLGIKPAAGKVKMEEFVLKKFTKEESETVKKITQAVPKMVETILAQGLDKAMTLFNKKSA